MKLLAVCYNISHVWVQKVKTTHIDISDNTLFHCTWKILIYSYKYLSSVIVLKYDDVVRLSSTKLMQSFIARVHLVQDSWLVQTGNLMSKKAGWLGLRGKLLWISFFLVCCLPGDSLEITWRIWKLLERALVYENLLKMQLKINKLLKRTLFYCEWEI